LVKADSIPIQDENKSNIIEKLKKMRERWKGGPSNCFLLPLEKYGEFNRDGRKIGYNAPTSLHKSTRAA